MGAVLADRTRSGRHPKRVGWRLWHECGVACHLERGLVLTEICGQPVFICMRTTLDLNDTLVRRAKALAAERGTSLTQLIEEALRLASEMKDEHGTDVAAGGSPVVTVS